MKGKKTSQPRMTHKTITHKTITHNTQSQNTETDIITQVRAG